MLWVKGATVFECTRRGSKRLKRGLFEFQYESRRDDLIWFSAVPFLLPELRTTSMYLKNRFVTLEHEPEQTFELVAECIPYAKIQISGSMTDWSINEITATHEIGLGRIHVGSRVNVRFDQISFNEPISDEYFKFEPRERQEE